MPVSFVSSLKLKTPPKAALKKWLAAIASREGKKKIKELLYNFVDDETLLEMNQRFLKHDTYTDIITFDYCEGNFISGEIYISADRLLENAAKNKVSFEEELLRVCAHGLLHLCGYKDKTAAQQQSMRAAENLAIKEFYANRR